MSQEKNVREWIKAFVNGDFEHRDFNTQVKAGWYDWFCRDTSLYGKTERMGRIIRQVKDGGKVDLDNWYVWFKNNCPMSGPLYDDFRFAEMSTGLVQFTIQIDCCWNKTRYAVFGRKNDFEEPLFETNKSRELVKWLNTPWDE